MTAPYDAPQGTAPLPTRAQLLRATVLAAVVAAALLVTVVLPAEYGVDPTGIGSRLGLRRSAISAAPISAEAAATVTMEPAAFRTDELQVTLAWGEDVEIKATMQKGQTMVFTWEASGGPVNVDMHGEPLNAVDGEATSYAKAEDQSTAAGAFRAPFDGRHGWFWENFNEKPVTITVRTSGYYSSIARQ